MTIAIHGTHYSDNTTSHPFLTFQTIPNSPFHPYIIDHPYHISDKTQTTNTKAFSYLTTSFI